MTNNAGWQDRLGVDISAYVGKTIYLVFREVDNQLLYDLGAGLSLLTK